MRTSGVETQTLVAVWAIQMIPGATWVEHRLTVTVRGRHIAYSRALQVLPSQRNPGHETKNQNCGVVTKSIEPGGGGGFVPAELGVSCPGAQVWRPGRKPAVSRCVGLLHHPPRLS